MKREITAGDVAALDALDEARRANSAAWRRNLREFRARERSAQIASIRWPVAVHTAALAAATADGVSLNAWILDAVEHELKRRKGRR